ncbi:MAG: serine hydrolase [Bacteroidetes bacterium]|nr:serine hydrolase [Bacteroidota bacterium]
MKKAILKIAGIFTLILLVAVLLNIKTIKKLKHVITLFDEENIVENFLNMEESFHFHLVEKSGDPTILPTKISYDVADQFSWEDSVFQTKDYMKTVNTTGLLIIHKDTIVHESYYNGMEENTTHISWSVAKSFVATLVGIALEEGLFESIQDPITKYLPALEKSGYDGVLIKDILQMSTGVKFNEDYRDFNSDINKFARTFALGKSFDEFVMSMKNETTPGTINHYVSINTQVLGMLVTKVSGKTLSEYLKEKIWDPMGMEFDAQWIIDDKGMELALGGLNVTLRDYAKLGLLYQHNGNWNGTQIVPEEWIRQSVTPDAPHLMAGPNELSTSDFGYGYQWWIPENSDGEFFAAGIYNQYIYIYPKKSLVIMKTAANHTFKDVGDQSKEIHVALLRTLSQDFPFTEEIVLEDPKTAIVELEGN